MLISPGVADGESKSIEALRREAMGIVDRLDRLSGPERAAAEERMQRIRGELADLGRGDGADPDAAAALDNVDGWMQQRGIRPRPAAGDRQPQTRSGAGGPSGPLPAPHGGIPNIPFTHDAMAALREARCKLCSLLREPRPDPLSGSIVDRRDWADRRQRLVVDMILAEEEMLDAVARHWVPYTPEDEQILDDGYGAVHDLRGTFEDIAKRDATIADHTKRLADIEQIHDGLREGLTGIKSDKTAKTVNGLVDSVGKLVDQRELDRMTSTAGSSTTPGSSMKLVKDLRGQTANLDKLAKNTSANVAKMGGKGNFAQAYAGFAGGMYRLLHQETQRALMEIEATNHADVAAVRNAREQLAEAHAQVLERRQGEALKTVNEYLERAGEPPFQLHSMSETDFANELDGKLQEMHLADSVERNFGTEASKRTTMLPTSKLGRFRKEHGKVFGNAEETELLQWCERNCPKKPAAVAVPDNKRTGLLLGGAAVAVIAIVIGSIAVFGGGDSSTSAPAATDAAVGTDAPAATEQPATDPPATDAPVAEPPPAFVPIGAGFRACPGVTHSPSPDYLGQPSNIWLHLLAMLFDAADGAYPGRTERASGTLTVSTPATGADTIDIVLVDGVGRGEVGISQYGPYEFQPVSFVSDDGQALPVTGGPILVDVGPAEGPIGGCVPFDEMDPDRLGEEEQLIIQDVLPDPGDAADSGGTDAAPGDAGGGVDVIVGGGDAGATPAPEDELGPYREFLTRFDTAHRAGDADSLLDWLSPTTLAIYGESQCRSYLEGVVGSVGELFLVDGRLDSPWTFTDTDGGDASAEVVGSFELDVELTQQGSERTTTQLHLLDTPNGVVWFTDCGNPR